MVNGEEARRSQEVGQNLDMGEVLKRHTHAAQEMIFFVAPTHDEHAHSTTTSSYPPRIDKVRGSEEESGGWSES